MKQIFLIEDDPLLVKMYTKAFSLSGYEVVSAFNGKDGLAKLKEMNPKPILIISDVMMPEMHGLELLEHVKENAELAKIPVVMLTNLARQADAEKALAQGAVMYLIKSEYKPKEVVAKVKEVIAGYESDDDVPSVSVEVKDPEAGETS